MNQPSSRMLLSASAASTSTSGCISISHVNTERRRMFLIKKEQRDDAKARVVEVVSVVEGSER